ncbi:MAG TPA: 4Fe-4S dicluster domain-containing protein [Candidatus Latescibacteria bacterium]|jgi:ethylbenzene hydroxylase subunit beta/complex iron-sulfur molybdoenzyme family reductase subunit beta|nr:4Fe-4S dicluster domain-containing protein [Candidatus Latescibacterota bacterium]|tara:strand:- start:944 stop:2005 length:1062 start_codon:yes stop_codon:yes gene_type:complete
MAQTTTKPERRQLAVVFDTNKCIGCQVCSLVCKKLWTEADGRESMWWTIVNTLPGRGTPKDVFTHGGGYRDGQPVPGVLPPKRDWGEAWNFEYEKVFASGTDEDRLIPLQPIDESGTAPTWGPNWDEDMGGGEYPNSYFFYLQQMCMNCSKPACMEACPRSAIYKRHEDGIVLIDEESCNGYRFCAEACPYKRIYFNESRNVAQKCISCFPRLETGVAPACIRQCPGRVQHVDYMDNEDGHIYKLVHKWQVALPLRPDFGCEPNMFYVPPISPAAFNENGEFDESRSRIPIEYLRELFGPGVDAALATLEAEREKVAAGGESELVDILISRRWHDLMGPFKTDPAKLDGKPVV